ARGYRNALLLPDGSGDLRKRYQEQRYIIKGVNPNNIYEVLRGYPRAHAVELDPTIDIWSEEGGGYPPWAYFTALFLVPASSWPVTKVFFGILNAFSLGIMAWFTYWVTRPYGRLPAIGLVTSVLAMGSNSFTLGMGQYGLLINAMIAGMALCLAAKRPIGAGMLYGLALLKPSISAPFFFALVVRRHWSAITAAIGYIAIASLAVWMMTRTDPMTMLLQMCDNRRAGGGSAEAHGLVNLALLLGISEPVALIAIA